MATISKGIKFYIKGGFGDEFTEVKNLQEIPDLGGSADSIEITTLADAAHTYTNGLLNYGDSLDFKFLYDVSEWVAINAYVEDGVARSIKVELPDKTTCIFDAFISAKLDGVGVNAALTFTVSLKPVSAMEWDYEPVTG